MKVLAIVLASTALWGQTPYSRDEIPKLPGLLWEDAKSVAQAPASWDASDWKALGLGAAAVLGTAVLLDKTLDDASKRNHTDARDRLATNLARPGGTAGLVLMGAGYLGFTVLGKDEPRSVIVDMGVATVLAQAAILPLKYGAGRARPLDGKGTHDFRALSSQDGFPSGHAAQAFAMASVISMRSTEPWVGWCAYGAAGLVGVARLGTRDHFASDVVAGALVGTVMGRAVVRVNEGIRSHAGRAAFSVEPAFSPGFKGVTVTARF
ncbi:phosphatase PAP2 family protein [Mesoterricola silvestris]|uniref:Phosphatase PAP2 family protein n=1 Tax=Mesoterricola silvestris TaxID=2927979 RepID=A0AA48GWE4_9BACT|nr:phosphatase PAP2 family protein [Mesoterricola silvestris]BDU73081.1 phosphatase PAP2 family protein [Mesoterricola silvestris]